MRYGRPKAGTGPGGTTGVEAFDSESPLGRGEAIAAALGLGEGAPINGGGSIEECEVGGLAGTAGSGNGAMSSSVRVSMMMSLVSTGAPRIW